MVRGGKQQRITDEYGIYVAWLVIQSRRNLPVHYVTKLPPLSAENSRYAGSDDMAGDQILVVTVLDRVRQVPPSVLLLLSGAFSALGFAPLNLWPLTFVALALLVACVAHTATAPQAFVRGWVFGLGHFIIGLSWIPTAFTHQMSMPSWVGWIAVVLLSAYLALFPALACGLARRLDESYSAGFIFIFAAAWMVCEWLRGSLLTGFAWNPIGVVWLHVPWVAQAAGWIGTYGLSALVVLVAGLLWLVMQRGWRVKAGVSMVLIALVLLPHLMPGEQPTPSTSGIPVRIVQPNIAQDEKYESAQISQHAQLYARLSGQPGPAPRLLLWPEAATLRLLELEPDVRASLAALLGPRDLLIIGGGSVSFGAQRSNDIYHNSVFALDSKGRLRWRYDKAHLVPFGEYLPLRRILQPMGLSRLVPGDGDFSPGLGPRTLPLPGFGSSGRQASVGVQICYEIVFSGHVIDRRQRPSFLFNPSNDAWFGAWGPPQHLAQAQLRAIEEGVSIVRATPNGISALIDPSGRLISTVPRNSVGVIDGFIPEPLSSTFFSRLGLWASAIFGFLLCVVSGTLRIFGRPHWIKKAPLVHKW